MTNQATIDRARQALHDHAWHDAYDAFSSRVRRPGHGGDDLMQLAEAAWWTARPKESVDALERAYATYSAEGNDPRAAYAALQLADRCNDALQRAQAAGWLRRATRLLDPLPEGLEHGYLELSLARRGGPPKR